MAEASLYDWHQRVKERSAGEFRPVEEDHNDGVGDRSCFCERRAAANPAGCGDAVYRVLGTW